MKWCGWDRFPRRCSFPLYALALESQRDDPILADQGAVALAAVLNRRTDNGRVRRFDLDLPEVIALRRTFLPESDQMRFLACSVLDLSWLDVLPHEPGHRFLFLAEGLFMYLPPQGVRSLVLALHERHPGSEPGGRGRPQHGRADDARTARPE